AGAPAHAGAEQHAFQRKIPRSALLSGLLERDSTRSSRGTNSAPLEPEATMFNHILVPMDFSAPSDAALECARAVAVQFAGSLHLLHVAEDPYRALYSAEVFVPEIEGLRDEILTDTTRRLNERLRPS